MTLCWSCEKQVAPAMLCEACRALLPPPGDADPFSLLGVRRRFTIDVAAAEARYKELARASHPDRFVRADARARRAAVQWSSRLNQAWRDIRDPFRRADLLLAGSGAAKPAAPPALLGEMMEQGEALAQARARGDDAAIATLARVARERADAGMVAVARALDGVDGGVSNDAASNDGADRDGVAGAALALMEVRYWRRFLEDVERDADHGPGQAARVGG